MPTPTRTTIAVAINFALLAAYGAGITSIAYSMYGPLLDMPSASAVGILAIVLGGLGLVHLAWTRWSPSQSLCLAVLFAAVVCCSVLLGVAVEALPATSRAIKLAPYLTSYQNIMERFFASDDARQYNYSDSLAGYNRPSKLPASPRLLTPYDDAYPSYTARTFAQAYCLSEGHHFCSALPLTTTILYPGIWSNPNMTAEIARTLSTLPATLANVTVTAATTIESLCADARIQDTTSTRDQTNALYRDLYDLCHGCITLRKITTTTSKHDALKVWIHDTCPMSAPQPSGVFCVATAHCLERDVQYAKRDSDVLCYSSWPLTYTNPSYNGCFGTTLMSSARKYVVAIAATSGVVLLLCLVLFVHVWKVPEATTQTTAKTTASQRQRHGRASDGHARVEACSLTKIRRVGDVNAIVSPTSFFKASALALIWREVPPSSEVSNLLWLMRLYLNTKRVCAHCLRRTGRLFLCAMLTS